VPCLEVVTDATPFGGGIVAISNFGFGGTNVHMLVKGGYSSHTPSPTHRTLSGDNGIITIRQMHEMPLYKMTIHSSTCFKEGSIYAMTCFDA
jgi:hypothetical protein